MGSPLGPLFANIFMSFHEKSWLHNCPSTFKPLLYRRYVDDCFLLFKSLDHVPRFLNYLNRQHPNISLTSELKRDGKLSFLDVEITRSNGNFFTCIYRKPTFIGLFTNFHPTFLRSGVVYLFKCRCCSASYLGQTTRHLHTRISEHLGISPITGKPSSSPVMSSIFSHLNTTGHSANFDDFTILSSCSNTS